ncbi:50S ribosomal protein L25 [Candidatus Peregrinibacteria bacterium]|nr:50S ribosomal protein L25 [Candidatus Peregrinibacteria bacterium]
MATASLTVQTRDAKTNTYNLRKVSILPGVYYGKGIEPVSLQMDYQSFRKVFLKTGTNSLIDLNIDGKKNEKVLVHDLQYDPLKGTVSHVDFIHVNLKEEVTTHIPVVVVGVAPAVKAFGGILNTVKHELNVRCLPLDLPHTIEVDVASLVDLSSSIHVSDLTPPKGVVFVDSPDDVVVTVTTASDEADTLPTAQTAEEAAGEAGAAPAEGAAAAPAAEEAKKEEKK